MAGYDLSIDMESLRTLADDLKTIVEEFKGADDSSEEAVRATGDPELSDRVQDFADKWRVKREEMTKDVEELQGIIEQIAETFTQVDEDLARALEQKAADAVR